MRKNKKVDPKMVQKMQIMEAIISSLREAGWSVIDNAEAYGFTKGTIVINGNYCDVQIKPITPNREKLRYEQIEE